MSLIEWREETKCQILGKHLVILREKLRNLSCDQFFLFSMRLSRVWLQNKAGEDRGQAQSPGTKHGSKIQRKDGGGGG
ncbi:hypothetical protein BaRGS_00021758, partial [Batillaria attramentaria]